MTDKDLDWQQCRSPFIPRKTVEGGWTSWMGQTWRRRDADGRWEYRQDPETMEQWEERNMSGW